MLISIQAQPSLVIVEDHRFSAVIVVPVLAQQLLQRLERRMTLQGVVERLDIDLANMWIEITILNTPVAH